MPGSVDKPTSRVRVQGLGRATEGVEAIKVWTHSKHKARGWGAYASASASSGCGDHGTLRLDVMPSVAPGEVTVVR